MLATFKVFSSHIGLVLNHAVAEHIYAVLLDICLREKLLGHKGMCLSSFIWYCQTVFQVVVLIYILTSSVGEFCLLCFCISSSGGCGAMVLIFICPMTSVSSLYRVCKKSKCFTLSFLSSFH